VKHYGEIPQGLQINHKCNNKSCINIEHLYAGTQADNMKDRVKAGTTNKNIVLGERKHRPWIYFQFETKIHDEIRELYATGKFTYPQLSELYNVSVFTITKLCKGKA
jgi:hypothetical protein